MDGWVNKVCNLYWSQLFVSSIMGCKLSPILNQVVFVPKPLLILSLMCFGCCKKCVKCLTKVRASVVISHRRPHLSNNCNKTPKNHLLILFLSSLTTTILHLCVPSYPPLLFLLSYMTDWLYSPQLTKCINSIFLVDMIQSIIVSPPLHILSNLRFSFNLSLPLLPLSLIRERGVSFSETT